MAVEMQPVQSGNIESAGYDPATRAAHFRFKTGGPTYVFENVPPEVAEEFAKSTSKGSYFHQRIKNQFKFQKIPATKTT